MLRHTSASVPRRSVYNGQSILKHRVGSEGLVINGMSTHVKADEQALEVTDTVLEAFKALSNPMRLQILQWLKDPREHFPAELAIADPDQVGVCVSHITEKANIAQSTVSSYMSILERANLVTSTRVGKWTHYRRNEQQIRELVQLLGRAL